MEVMVPLAITVDVIVIILVMTAYRQQPRSVSDRIGTALIISILLLNLVTLVTTLTP